MSTKLNNSYNIKQPFLYVIDSFDPEVDLEKYDNVLKKYDPKRKFIFTFLTEGSKAFFEFNNDITKDELCRILQIKNDNKIIKIPQLSENDFNNFPNELLICPLPKCFRDKYTFKSFIDHIVPKNVECDHNYYFDYRTITTKSCFSAIIFQFINNLSFDSCSAQAIHSRSGFLPVMLVRNIPASFKDNIFDLKDIFQYYLKKKVITVNELDRNQQSNTISARITFQNIDIAKEAVSIFNFASFDDNEIYTNLFTPKEDYYNEMKSWKLKIEGIPEDLTSRQLFKAFNRFGNIFKAYVKKKENLDPIGYVLYYDKNDAIEVEKKADQATLNGRLINVFRSRKIKIYNFSSATKEDIEDTFSNYNPVSIKIIDKDGQRPVVKISFKTDSEASEAIEIASGMSSMGMKLYAENICYSEKSTENAFSKEKSLKLSGLPKDYTQLQLIELCGVYGLLAKAEISSNSESSDAHVEFDSKESAKHALEKMEGLAIEGNPVIVEKYK